MPTMMREPAWSRVPLLSHTEFLKGCRHVASVAPRQRAAMARPSVRAKLKGRQPRSCTAKPFKVE
jgi:hypothetical protein